MPLSISISVLLLLAGLWISVMWLPPDAAATAGSLLILAMGSVGFAVGLALDMQDEPQTGREIVIRWGPYLSRLLVVSSGLWIGAVAHHIWAPAVSFILVIVVAAKLSHGSAFTANAYGILLLTAGLFVSIAAAMLVRLAIVP